MPIYRGTQQLAALYKGGTAIGQVYHGSTLVFDSGTAVSAATPFAASGATTPVIGCATYPAAFYDSTGDRTWLAWEGWDGERVVYVQTYDHANNRWEKRYEVSRDTLTDDDHGVPAICMDHEGFVHCFFGSHVSAVKYAVTASARDPSAWQQQADIDSTATYPHPVMVGTTLYLFLRTRDGSSDAYWTRYKTTALIGGVATWGATQNVVYFSGGRFYQSSAHVDGTSIHFVAVYANAIDTERSNLYHFVYDTTDDSVDNSDSSTSNSLVGQPVSKFGADTNYRIESPARTDVGDFCITSDGTLHAAYIDDSASPWDIKYINNSGSGWSTPAAITSMSGSGAAGFIDSIALVPRADGSVELWYPNDSSAAYAQGGDMKRIVRSPGGTWGSEETILAADSSGLARPITVRDADESLYVLFTEVAADSDDTSAGGLQLWAYGSGGFVVGDAPSFTSDPTITSSDTFFGTGDVLTAQNEHTGTSETYQWKRDGSDITGATGHSYTLTASDEGTTITVAVTATNHVGSTVATSSGVSAVAPTFATQTRTLSDASNRTLSDTSDRTISNRTA
jgi:hypothetical protein